MGFMTGVTSVFNRSVDIFTGCFLVVAILTRCRWFGRRLVRVVALLAFIFVKGGMFVGFLVDTFVTCTALPDGGRLEKAGRIGSVGVVAQLAIPCKPGFAVQAVFLAGVASDA